MRVPDDAKPGKVKVEVDFSAWEVLAQPKCTTEIEVRSMPVIPQKETVSAQHQKTLSHPDKQSSFSSLFYSKDGKRLIAGGYPEGTVVVYDVASGSRLTEINTDKSWRGTSKFAHVTPDEKTLITTLERFEKIEYYDKDQQPMKRKVGGNSLRRWNLETGELLWKDTRPNRGRPNWFKLSPDGKKFVMQEDPPGEYPRTHSQPYISWLGETATGNLLPFPVLINAHGLFTSDSKLFATTQSDGVRFFQAIKLYDTTALKELRSWPQQKNTHLHIWEMPYDRQLLYFEDIFSGTNETLPLTKKLKLLDITNADKPAMVILADTRDCYNFVLNHDKTRLLYLKKQGIQYTLKQVQLSDGKEVLSTPVPSEEKRFYGTTQTLSPDGKLLALAQWREIPKELYTLDEIKPEQIGQPRIILVEVATGKVKATLVSPSAFLAGIAFSPDGKQLASSGSGCIHLWDVSELK